MSIFVSGLDLGLAHDFTALVILEASGARRMVTADQRDRETGMPITTNRPIEMMPLVQAEVRWVERLNGKVRYSYTEMRGIVKDRMVRLKKEETGKQSYLAIDKTGVGVGVAEIFADLWPIGVTITGSGQAIRHGEQDYNVPKKDLVSCVQILLQNQVLKIADKIEHAEILRKELLAFRTKITAAGGQTFEAWREKDHDDMVLALAIAIWTAQQIISANAAAALAQYRNRREPPGISPY